MKWEKVSEARYWEMLGMLPPAVQSGFGFLVGEPWSHGVCSMTGKTLPLYRAFAETGAGEFFESRGHMTVPEFLMLKMEEVRA